MLEKDCIDVWGFSLDAGTDALERFHLWLSEDERARGARFIHRENQRRFTFAHGGLRAVLARYTGMDPGALRFRTNATGKPGLINQEDSSGVEFNLSHSHGCMLITVGEGRDVGTDLEQIRDTVEVVKLAERFYAPREFQRIMSYAAPDQKRVFYRYWVAKEAVLKGQGVGLSSLQQCEILSPDLVSRSAMHVPFNSRLQSGWMIQWLNCGAGWQGAVSAYGSHWRVRIMIAES